MASFEEVLKREQEREGFLGTLVHIHPPLARKLRDEGYHPELIRAVFGALVKPGQTILGRAIGERLVNLIEEMKPKLPTDPNHARRLMGEEFENFVATPPLTTEQKEKVHELLRRLKG